MPRWMTCTPLAHFLVTYYCSRANPSTKQPTLSLSLAHAPTHTHSERWRKAMVMALRASATSRPPLPTPPSSPYLPPRKVSVSKNASKPPSRPSSASLPISTTLSLFALFTNASHEAKALSLSKEDIVSSLNQAEKTIDQVLDVGSNFFDVAQRAFQVVAETVKPGVDVALPILQQAGEQAVRIASPAISEASKKAQEAMQSSGFDTQPVLTAVKVWPRFFSQQSLVLIGTVKLVVDKL